MTNYNGVRTHCASLKDVSGLLFLPFLQSSAYLDLGVWEGEKENINYVMSNSALDNRGRGFL